MTDTPAPKKRGRPRKEKAQKPETLPETSVQTPPETKIEENTDSKIEEKVEFRITADFGEEVVSSTGETILEALENLKRPVKIVGKTFIRLSHGKKVSKLMFMPVRAKRLFYPNAQVYLSKQLEFLLK